MDYKRKFIILNREDEKYCQKGASGYCKIESYSGKSHIKIFLQGLKILERHQKYCIYMICYNSKNIEYVCLGEIEGKNTKNELVKVVDSSNVMSSNLDISKFNMCAIYTYDDNDICFHQYPLVGYDEVEKNDIWKIRLNNEIEKNKKNLKLIAEKNLKLKAEKNDMINERKVEVPTPPKEPIQLKEIIQIEKSGEGNYYNYVRNNDFESINKFMKQMSGVSEINPFTMVKLKYKWWKIENLKFFDNISKNNILINQILKHPLIKKKIREINYCLYGLVSDSNSNIKYMTLGIPSNYFTNDQIYIGGFSTFYPSNGFDRKNGDFGYWIVHIKIDSQNIVMNI